MKHIKIDDNKQLSTAILDEVENVEICSGSSGDPGYLDFLLK